MSQRIIRAFGNIFCSKIVLKNPNSWVFIEIYDKIIYIRGQFYLIIGYKGYLFGTNIDIISKTIRNFKKYDENEM